MQIRDEDWQSWCDKYVDPLLRSKEYELIVDEVASNILEFPLFTPEFCSEVIELAETAGDWNTQRHSSYPTTDILLEKLGMKDLYNRVINEFVHPLACWFWKLEGPTWHRTDHEEESFVAKYEPDKQSHLSLHHDSSTITCVVKLNDQFTGGGTYFPMYKTLVHPKQIGHAFIHPGRLTHKHGARPVLTGKRYVLVSFID